MTTTEKPSTQLTLLEKDLWVETRELVYLAELPDDDALRSPPPSKLLVESVREHGVLVPIAVQETKGSHGNVTYRVIDGRRRIKAARLAEITSIPALLVDAPGTSAHALAAHYHATRSANPISDLESIDALRKALVAEGRLNAAEIVSEIAKATGLAFGTVKTRLQLLTLPTCFLTGVMDGRITMALAEKLAKLPRERQNHLIDVFAQKGRLTEADAKAEVQKGATEAVAQFDWDQIDAVPPARVQVPFAVLEPIRKALSETFDNWSMDEATGTFVVSGQDGPTYRIQVVPE